MRLTGKEQFDGLMKLKKEIELIQFLKEFNNQFKDSNFVELNLTDEFKPEEITEEDDKASVTIPVYIESYILTVLDLGDRVTIADILTASSDEFSLEIDKVRAWLKDPKHQRDLLHIYFGGAYTVEKEVKNTPKYSLTISSTEYETKVVLKDTASNKFKLVDEDTYYDIKDTPWVEDEFTPDELTDLKLEKLLGDF